MALPSSTDEIRARYDQIVEQYGSWTAHSIQLADDFNTLPDPDRVSGNGKALRRVLQIASDVTLRPLRELRVLDLACLEGMYGIEFARNGAQVVAIEAREQHIAKARFAAETLGLTSYEILKDDVRNLSPERHGHFDVVLCLGILYHLKAPDVFDFIARMASVCTQAVILDTHISLGKGRRFPFRGRTYRGRRILEHLPWKTTMERARKPWASLDNTWSVWLTAPSLSNALQDVGFTSVYQCEVPAMAGRIDHRRTFLALKGTPVTIASTPPVNDLPLDRADDIQAGAEALRWFRWLFGSVRTKIRHWRGR
jgi:2-polyprenyl-3-methyl-5-hydroxy-6-metoxy-1,4-benzoquinol methylase